MSATTSAAGDVPSSGGNIGQAWQQTGAETFAAIDFMVRQIIAGKTFNAIVKVQSVTGGGTMAPPTVAVQPMVNQIDGLGNSEPHGTVYNLPAFRMQAGGSGIICDPVVGDIGLAIICDRDISSVKETQAVSNPGSFRTNSWADGCYLGGFLNGTLAQFIQFMANNAGVNIVTPGTISLSAGGQITIASGSNNTMIDGKVFLPHEHTLVTTGTHNSGPVA